MLIFLVTFIVMLAAQPLLKKYLPTAPAPQKINQPEQAQPEQAQPASPAGPAVAPAVPAGVTKRAPDEAETVIENDLYRITFTNRGAQVKSWILKRYDNDVEKGPLDLVNP